ncbi:hypothetical protein [Halarcobacter anaerophilus]|uniref:hypothetical protein n=2 Tax=Halarcobacter anaerophilus TaxID=877500 RepID=UPI001E3A6B9C|nr:hypothetical protein [Halarcobacter anaerophilus]
MKQCLIMLICMQEGDVRCRLAVQIVAYNIKESVSSYVAAFDRVDALYFTGVLVKIPR